MILNTVGIVSGERITRNKAVTILARTILDLTTFSHPFTLSSKDRTGLAHDRPISAASRHSS